MLYLYPYIYIYIYIYIITINPYSYICVCLYYIYIYIYEIYICPFNFCIVCYLCIYLEYGNFITQLTFLLGGNRSLSMILMATSLPVFLCFPALYQKGLSISILWCVFFHSFNGCKVWLYSMFIYCKYYNVYPHHILILLHTICKKKSLCCIKILSISNFYIEYIKYSKFKYLNTVKDTLYFLLIQIPEHFLTGCSCQRTPCK